MNDLGGGCEGNSGGDVTLGGPIGATLADGVTFDEEPARKSKSSQSVDCWVTPRFGWLPDGLDGPAMLLLSPSKSSPDSRSISFGAWVCIRAEGVVLDDIGGGARGAGRCAGLLLSIDSSEAISSVRPPSIAKRSPIAFS